MVEIRDAVARERKTLANGASQRLAAVAAQRLVKPAEHIVKPQLAAYILCLAP
jgi:hypothetical protein